MMPFRTIETISGSYFDVAFVSQQVKPCVAYNGGSSNFKPKVRIELTHGGKTHRATTIAELIDDVKQFGIFPSEYAASEPIAFARACFSQ